jgi:hypothetical protein
MGEVADIALGHNCHFFGLRRKEWAPAYNIIIHPHKFSTGVTFGVPYILLFITSLCVLNVWLGAVAGLLCEYCGCAFQHACAPADTVECYWFAAAWREYRSTMSCHCNTVHGRTKCCQERQKQGLESVPLNVFLSV